MKRLNNLEKGKEIFSKFINFINENPNYLFEDSKITDFYVQEITHQGGIGGRTSKKDITNIVVVNVNDQVIYLNEDTSLNKLLEEMTFKIWIKEKFQTTDILELNGKVIVDTFQYQVCLNYEKAEEMGINDYGWNKDDIEEGIEKLSVKLQDGEIVDTKLNCIYIDSGSVDYIYYLS